MTGLLLLAGTPIGDPQDASPRLVRALTESDVVAAEDTRRLSRLTSALGVQPTGRVLSLPRAQRVAADAGACSSLLVGGATVVVVTDAGMPSVSDPGYRLVVAAVGAGVRVSAVPGPSAVLTALAVSGLPVDRFCFEGFLPRKAGSARGRSPPSPASGARRCSSRRRTGSRRPSPRWPRRSAKTARSPSAASSPRRTSRWCADRCTRCSSGRPARCAAR
ncbi:hypothetical protein GCM10025868_15340 [Angustibacter aerolatus]|uniref:Tetrapyrrole methylase domain-containing protein n=1 Tax=Angustibacter aerolatus TaxID=1162965 RepID=A0ABQ6JGM7_9ACTN|nr:hypothetical protein GCM10025868_15340 [Angustibacter aerolatus]